VADRLRRRSPFENERIEAVLVELELAYPVVKSLVGGDCVLVVRRNADDLLSVAADKGFTTG
jgi:hypothetical protein